MSSLAKLTRKAVAVWPLILVLVATMFGVAAWPYFSGRKDLGIQKKPLIQELIYPTFGNPAIVKKGTQLVVEFDPRNRDFTQPFQRVRNFSALARTSCDPNPLEADLDVVSSKVGTSTRWPEYQPRAGRDMRIYLVTLSVPASLPVDLYDLTVEGSLPEGERLQDRQPHALEAVDRYKDDLTICQMTDIHVYGPELDYPFANYYMRGKRQGGIRPGRKGAVYYQKEIAQINTIKPDFCVFTGDYMYGQEYFLQDQERPWGLTTEYEYEMLWFYQETLKLDVPVFMAIGNHDSFAEGDEGAHEDWFENWRRIFGPLYHSFDYGDYHFLALNSQDWPVAQRTLVDYDVSIQSEKYKGQFLGGGDAWAPGVDSARIAAINDAGLTGQLGWMRDDLAAHQGSRLRVVLTHQDPWRQQGSGLMWASGKASKGDLMSGVKSALGFAGVYGNGAGRLAAIKLMSEYGVALELSGHLHSDFVETMPWLGGSGAMISANTTCSQFAIEGPSNSYPGYRLIQIRSGKVVSVNYAEPRWSYPFFAGTNVGGVTDLGKLTVPAIETSVTGKAGSRVEVVIKNHLAKPIEGAFVRVPVSYLSRGGYFAVSGGHIEAAHDSGDEHPAVRTFYLVTDVPAGKTAVVTLTRAASPDHQAPAGAVQVNGGARATGALAVTLDVAASDGGAGVKDMMISNTGDFEDAEWQECRPQSEWTLAAGGPGPRAVYVKLRDYAMPANVSQAFTATVLYAP